MSTFLLLFMGFLMGAPLGAFLMRRHKMAEHVVALSASDARWRVAMSKLIGYLLCLGYETTLTDDNFEVDATPDNYLISMPIRRFDPTTLLETLKDLPPAREWLNHREGKGESTEDPPPAPTVAPSDPPASDPPA